MKENTTPAMRQYLDIKRENSDSILFFRMGDFYEMFFDDAKRASRILGIALTSRDKGREIPMCGIPYHAAATYIAKLVRDGHKVAVCEQVEDPGEAKGIVRREVTKIITPGVAFDDELLDPKANNFIASVSIGADKFGFSCMDVSTGEFRVTEFPTKPQLYDEIKRISPLELVVSEGPKEAFDGNEFRIKKISEIPAYDFSFEAAAGRLNSHFGTSSLDGFGCRDFTEGVRAAGALLKYVKDTQRSGLAHADKLTPYFTEECLVIDSSTRRNLEIIENTGNGGKAGTLLDVLDRTRTAMGGRRLRSWLLNPLKNVGEIKLRQDSVSELLGNRELRVKLQELLNEVYDIERLTVKVSLGSANPRDLVSLSLSLKKIPQIKGLLKFFSSGILTDAAGSLDEVAEASTLIENSINETPPISVRDGGVIRKGFNQDLDELRVIGAGGKDWIASLEAGEKKRTGISSLKIGYNKVFGYFIEVSNARLENVPPEYIRKQTLVNAERFITPALKEWEDKILSAEDKAKALEERLFNEIRAEAAGYCERLKVTAGKVSVLDALSSLAEAAEAGDYVRPEVNESAAVQIDGGRHPVIERNSEDGFVSNDLALDGRNSQIMVLTGPNMAGKSTYLRQNALIILMAQIGSFVPAKSASIGVVDRIFSRVGASDDLSRGQSTFMVEMNETANILNNATARSFIILDEIGRGTSTFDGLSIAWAVVEYIHDSPLSRAKTLFATHYHELTELSLTKERVKNYNMAVKEHGDRIVFLRKVVPGGASRSYGIQVARLAGLPKEVIERAKEVLKNLETGEINDSGIPRIAVKYGNDASRQLSLLDEKDLIREELKLIEIDSLTPLEALTRLNKMKEMLES